MQVLRVLLEYKISFFLLCFSRCFLFLFQLETLPHISQLLFSFGALEDTAFALLLQES